ncbi:MAG: IS66 family transposase [Aeriscardovia sp.]|nr:IS66 family transposase [Aeriscardovia sp.]
MKTFGITDPAELTKIKRVTSAPSETVYLVPATLVRVNNYHYRYIYDKKEFSPPVKASDWKLLPGSVTSESLLAYVFDQMTFHHQPMNRIAEELRKMGFEIGRDAYPRWSIRMVTDYLDALYHRLWQLIRDYDHLHIDETFFQVIHDGRKAGSNSYMWIYRPSELLKDARPITIFQFDETRGTDVLRTTLPGWFGVISCDGFSDYKTFQEENKERILLATCWAHLRRKFAQACKIIGIKKIPKEERDKVPAYHALMEIAEIFTIEKELKNVTPEERKRERNGEMKKIMERLFEYFRNLKEKGRLGEVTAEAVDYALNMEESLLRCLDDPLIPLTNSHAERGALFFALSRNSFKQIDSLDGAYALSVLMSIACTAKACEVNGYLYFKYLLEKLPALIRKHGMPKGDIRKLDLSYLDPMLPWSKEYKAYEEKEQTVLKNAACEFASNWYIEKGYTVVIPDICPVESGAVAIPSGM